MIRKHLSHGIIFAILLFLSVVFLLPILIIIINSLKFKFSITEAPFALPNSETFSGFENYISGFTQTDFGTAFFWSLFITVFSVAAIVIFTSMTAWYIVRAKTLLTTVLYYALVFSMIVPFQMVMFTMSKVANILMLDNPVGIILIYLGFGAGLATFMFSGFVKSVPKTVEEAATIDGCGYFRILVYIIVPAIKSAMIVVGLLKFIELWNDLLQQVTYITRRENYTLALGLNIFKGSFNDDWSSIMCATCLSFIPGIVFYLIGQRYFVEGIVMTGMKN